VKEGLKLNLVLRTSGLIPSCYIGSRRGRGLVGRGSGAVGRRRKWDNGS
jgi:hypothetical protein